MLVESDPELIEILTEIERRIANLINSEKVSDEEKLSIARKALMIIESAKKGEAVQ